MASDEGIILGAWVLFNMFLVTAVLMAPQWTLNLGSPTRLTDSGNVYDAFATMVKAGNGTILNFYRKGTSHAGDRGVIMLQTSTDNGATWAPFSGANYCQSGDPPGCLFADISSNQFDSRNTSGGLSYDGSTVIFFWMQYNQTGGTVGGVPSGASAGVFYSRSTNNGSSWSSPIQLPRYYWTYGQLVVVLNGGGASGSCSTGCVAVSLGNNQTSSGGHQRLVFSYNNGSTWDSANDKAIPGAIQDELALLWIKGDQIIGIDRPNTTGNLIFMSSNDLGTSWTTTTSNITLVPTPPGWTVAANGQSQVSPWLTKPNPDLGDGSITLFYAERDNWNDPSTQHVYNFLRAITFRPQDAIASPTGFATPQDIYTQLPPVTGFVNFGYPTVVEIPGNTLLIEWYQQVSASQLTPVNLYMITGQYQSSQAGFMVSALPLTPASVTPGQSAISSITVTSLNSFSDVVNLSCSVSPLGPGCAVSPTSVTPAANSSAMAALTVNTTAPSTANTVLPPPADGDHDTLSLNSLLLSVLGLALVSFGRAFDRSRKKWLIALLLCCVLIAGLVFITACGGLSSRNQTPGASPGTYTVTVIGRSGSTTRTTRLNLVVR